MKKEDFIQEFAKNFKNMIKNNFDSQKQFAEIFDEKTSVISTWSTGKYLPDIYKLHKIADYLGVSIDYIVRGEPLGEVTKKTLDYNLFNEVVLFVNEIGKELGKTPTGRQYLAIYDNVTGYQTINKHITQELNLEQIFSLIKPTIISTWQS